MITLNKELIKAGKRIVAKYASLDHILEEAIASIARRSRGRSVDDSDEFSDTLESPNHFSDSSDEEQDENANPNAQEEVPPPPVPTLEKRRMTRSMAQADETK